MRLSHGRFAIHGETGSVLPPNSSTLCCGAKKGLATGTEDNFARAFLLFQTYPRYSVPSDIKGTTQIRVILFIR